MSYTLLNPCPATLGSLLTATSSGQSTAAGIDTETLGAHLTLAAGTWLLWGSAALGSVGASDSNNQISFGTASGGWSGSHQRIWHAKSWWAELTSSYIVALDASTEVYVRYSSSVARSGCKSELRALRLA